MKSSNIADTNSRLKDGLNSLTQDFYNKQDIPSQIQTAINDNMICTGVMTKFYPYINKCEVKLDTTGEKVLCKNSLLFMGDMVLLYTPSGESDYCDKLHEPCVIPRGNIGCIVAHLNSGDEDYLFLSYYAREEFIGLNPSKMGQFKILAMDGISEFSLRFGIEGMKIVNNGEIENVVLDNWGEEVPQVKDYYTKDEVYNKEEIDEMIYPKTELYTKAEIDEIVEELREEFDPDYHPPNNNNNDDGGE